MVRYRIDGILHDVMTLPKIIQLAVVARIKVLSNLKIDEHRLPQDGRFKLQTDEYNISFRVSTIPIFDGEKVVLRLLDEGAKAVTFEELGFARSSLLIIKRNLTRPHGMTLVTGPTGSGKSTTFTSWPSFRRCLIRSPACVALPEPSVPAMTISLPRLLVRTIRKIYQKKS